MVACNGVTSLPNASPKPPGMTKSRCISMMSNAVLFGSKSSAYGSASMDFCVIAGSPLGHALHAILNRILDPQEKKAVSLNLGALQADYRSGRRTPSQVITDLVTRADRGTYANAWIHRVDEATLLRRA